MEGQNTKIPRLREKGYQRSQQTSIDLKPSRWITEYEPPQRTYSLSEIPPYKPLTPEQFTVHYKIYPQRFLKRSCAICGMRKPHKLIRDTKSEDTRPQFSSISTQTLPPPPPPERWNANTQTVDEDKLIVQTMDEDELVVPASLLIPRYTQTDKLVGVLRFIASFMSWGKWIAAFFGLFAVVVCVFIKYMDVFKYFSPKQLRQPKTYLELMVSYVHREQIMEELADHSLGQINLPSVLLLLTSYIFIIVLLIN